jgi:hypothetical protein
MYDHDRSYVFRSWKRSYRESRRAHEWPLEVYDAYMQRLIEHLLARSRVLVARPEGWPEGILGWACAQQADDAFVLHYAYVKRRARARTTGGDSLLWALVEAMAPRGKLLYSHRRAPYTFALDGHGYEFAPERASLREDVHESG